MNKRTLTIIFTVASALLILDMHNMGHALFMFLLAGVVPGTNIVVSAAHMLEVILFVAGFTLSRIAMWIFTTASRTYASSKGTTLSAQS